MDSFAVVLTGKFSINKDTTPEIIKEEEKKRKLNKKAIKRARFIEN